MGKNSKGQQMACGLLKYSSVQCPMGDERTLAEQTEKLEGSLGCYLREECNAVKETPLDAPEKPAETFPW